MILSLHYSHFILLDLILDLSLQICDILNDNLLHSRSLLIAVPFLKVDPPAEGKPYFILLLRISLLQLSLYIQQNLIACPNWIIKIRKSTSSIGLLLRNRHEGLLGLHWFFDAIEVFLMLDVWIFDFIELLLAGVVVIERVWIKEILELCWFFEDVQSHFESCVLEFYNKVDEDLVFNLRNLEFFTDSPKLFGHPVSNYRHIFKVLHESFDISDLLCEKARQPELSPGSSFLIFINQS